MRVLYAGLPGTGHTAAWLEHLGTLGPTDVVDVAALGDADLSGVDVLVVDAPGRDVPVPQVSLDQLSCPTVLVGHYGSSLAEALHLKLGTWFGCKCLHEDAIIWDPAHPVFAGRSPCPTQTPAHFLSERARLLFRAPETLQTLRVVDSADEAGQVTTGLGFLDSPECEVIAGGLNDKTVDHFAIGRQGRFLQWGFAGSPAQLTDDGRALLTACVHYIAAFRDDPVRELRTTPPRAILKFQLAAPAWRGEGMPVEFRAMMQQSFLDRTFVGTTPVEVIESEAAALAWFADHRGFLRNDGRGWYVDAEAGALGLGIDNPQFLDAVLKAGDAELWRRYTGKALDEGSARWLDEHRDHLYFTDWGGYRWVSVLEPPTPHAPAEPPVIPQAAAIAAAARYDGVTRAVFSLSLPDGFHAYGPGAEDGLPLALADVDGLTVIEGLELFPATEHVTGVVQGRFAVVGTGSELAAALRVQLCDDLTCLAPQTVPLQCSVLEGTS